MSSEQEFVPDNGNSPNVNANLNDSMNSTSNDIDLDHSHNSRTYEYEHEENAANNTGGNESDVELSDDMSMNKARVSKPLSIPKQRTRYEQENTTDNT